MNWYFFILIEKSESRIEYEFIRPCQVLRPIFSLPLAPSSLVCGLQKFFHLLEMGSYTRKNKCPFPKFYLNSSGRVETRWKIGAQALNFRHRACLELSVALKYSRTFCKVSLWNFEIFLHFLIWSLAFEQWMNNFTFYNGCTERKAPPITTCSVLIRHLFKYWQILLDFDSVKDF